eukprot:COSAG02_NODE_322_length_24779_cov_14.118233_7_plen_41_part_00
MPRVQKEHLRTGADASNEEEGEARQLEVAIARRATENNKD